MDGELGEGEAYSFTVEGFIYFLVHIDQLWSDWLASRFRKMGKSIQHFLKPKWLNSIMVEFHPVIWMFDDDFTKVAYDYQSTEPIVETYEGTYADKDAAITQEYVMWNHALSEVFQSLINQNLEIKLSRIRLVTVCKF